jgi:hypothetical protein
MATLAVQFRMGDTNAPRSSASLNLPSIDPASRIGNLRSHRFRAPCFCPLSDLDLLQLERFVFGQDQLGVAHGN